MDTPDSNPNSDKWVASTAPKIAPVKEKDAYFMTFAGVGALLESLAEGRSAETEMPSSGTSTEMVAWQ